MCDVNAMACTQRLDNLDSHDSDNHILNPQNRLSIEVTVFKLEHVSPATFHPFFSKRDVFWQRKPVVSLSHFSVLHKPFDSKFRTKLYHACEKVLLGLQKILMC